MRIEANLRVVKRRPDFEIPTADAFQIEFCEDPTCGPHFVLLDRDDKPFCEFVMSVEQFFTAESRLIDHYNKPKE